ncbi:MAG: DUF3179 domain-containing protein [Chloroflexi bacterium]|nr:DUF3179 domain-containing protein [Chloroflexota bacterium]
MFRRTVDGQILDFGTTGLLRFSNLVMYDRQTESWWQEGGGEAVVGDMTGQRLELAPLSIVSWKEFKAEYPKGKVLSRATGYKRPYGTNPYVSYDSASAPFLFHEAVDRRLPALERVVGISVGKESLAVPYSVLETEPLVHLTLGGHDLVIFYEKGLSSVLDKESTARGRDVGSAGVFSPYAGSQKLTFHIAEGRVVDDQTGSSWSLLGIGQTGPLLGVSLRPLVHSPAQFWFSWVVFKPDTLIYRGKS